MTQILVKMSQIFDSEYVAITREDFETLIRLSDRKFSRSTNPELVERLLSARKANWIVKKEDNKNEK